MNKKTERRKYEEKLETKLLSNDEFLINKLKKEWDLIEKAAKREKIIRQTKEAGIIIAKSILALAAIAGVLFVAVAAPNVFSAFGKRPFRRGFFEKNNFKQGLYYLKRQGYVEVISGYNVTGMKISITSRGRKEVLKTAFSALKINKQQKWDGVWRILAFDIPEKHKWSRDGFRRKLKLMGLYPMQESVFITPYPCEEEISFVAYIYGIVPYLRYIETRRMNDDSDLRNFFNL